MRHAVILAGGGGTRLWPASRRARPKQFVPLGASGETLLSTCVRRARTVADRVWIVTAEDQVALVREALGPASTERVLTEPAARNTAAAVGLAAAHAAHDDPGATLAVLPSDHHIADEAAFTRAIARAFELAEREDAIVTVGIKPTRPETGFGWLQIGSDRMRVERFTEKPDRATAERWLIEGSHLWNAGMFFFRAARILDEIRRLMPETGSALDQIAAALPDADEVTRRVYHALPSTSIDYGVMEKARGIFAIEADFEWNDLGTWPAVGSIFDRDGRGNAVSGEAMFLDAGGNIVVSDPDTMVAVVGVDDLVIVRSGNAVLVVPRARAQEVKDVVAALERRRLDTYL